MKKQTDTIVAMATPPGRGGVAIVRISGPLTTKIAKSILKKIPKARYATYSYFYDENDIALDQGLALFFTTPHSFTGEDILELHGHGGPMVVDNVIQRVLQLGARLARPGEFSERAFLNNKIDLVQAEAIADLIDASSTQAARSALRSLQGDFSKKIDAALKQLIHLRMYVEAAIDFVEEEINFLADKKIAEDLAELIQTMKSIQAAAVQGSLMREGITAVIAGKPNVGKSSLLNRLSGKEVAIVTDIAGTTRDVLREHIQIDGLPMHIIDTAGLRESDDKVEQEGMRRAREAIAQADLVLHVIDVTDPDGTDLIDDLEQLATQAKKITIRNKIDLLKETPTLVENNNRTIISLSAKQDIGIELLRNHIKNSVGYHANLEGTFSARRRHLDALLRTQSCLLKGQHQLQEHQAGELLAEELRQAQQALSEITGEFTSDDLLGQIFSSFCIGK